MENVIVTLSLDVYDYDKSEVSMKAIACDKDVRRIRARFHRNGFTYDIGSNARVYLVVVRPDGVGVQLGCVAFPYTDGYTVYGAEARLRGSALAVEGTAYAQFLIEDSVTRTLRTEIFKIEVGKALDQDTEEWADTYQGYNLDDLVQKLEAINISSIDTDGSTIVIKTENDGQEYHDYVDNKIEELKREMATGVRVEVSDAVYITTTAGGTGNGS